MKCPECKWQKKSENCQACYIKAKKKLELAEGQLIGDKKKARKDISNINTDNSAIIKEIHRSYRTKLKFIIDYKKPFQAKKQLFELLEELET